MFASCTSTKENGLEQNEDATPTVLLEDNSSSDFDSYLTKSARWKNDDIIQKLFAEACEKDKTLKDLNEKIESVGGIKDDSLKIYDDYFSINNDYWSTAQSYIIRLNDSILKESTTAVFDKLACDYEKRMIDYSNKIEILDQRTINLEDQLILMKLMVTQPMIENFEINEKPPIKILEDLIKNYDDLIKETQVYME
jgi:hypothetical protein